MKMVPAISKGMVCRTVPESFFCDELKVIQVNIKSKRWTKILLNYY